MIHKHLSVTFDQFATSLTEYMDQQWIDEYFSEALALYSAGFTVEQVAKTILHLVNNPDAL